MYNLFQEEEDSLESSMDSLENDKMTVDGIHQDFKGGNTTSVLGKSVSEGVDQDSLNSTEDECSHNINRKPYLSYDTDDGDLNESPEDQGTISKSWHGPRSISKKGLSFFVDFDSCGPPSSCNRSLSHSETQGRYSSARTRSQTSCVVDQDCSKPGILSSSRVEESAWLTEMSTIKTKSEQLLSQNLKLSEQFFNKLKAFIDTLNMSCYSIEEVLQKKILSDKIIRVMFEEEQRLRQGGDLSEIQQLDKILHVKPDWAILSYSTLNDMQVDDQNNQKVDLQICTAQKESCTIKMKDKPVLRREQTFEQDNSNSIFSKETKELKNENRKYMPINQTLTVSESGNRKAMKEITKVGWMLEGSRISSEMQTSSDLKLG